MVGLLTVFSYEVTPEDYLAEGDDYLSKGSYAEAVNSYKIGIDRLADDESLLTVLSLETNLATALSLMSLNHEAIQYYQKAISTYMAEIDDIADHETAQHAKAIAASAAFYLGMEYQDDGQAENAVEAYGYAIVLDPNHWSALANLGSVLHDNLSNHDEALNAYNKAYEILTSKDKVPSDPPTDPRMILSQLQYRIGLCLNHNPNRKCALSDDPDKEVSCQEMAAHAFSLAVEYDHENESAKHMLATVTADATLKRASNTYVKTLFDDYAQNFEHSLVQELGYDGYERLRRGFDRAFGGQDKVPTFPLVIDAGCGTGLVGEQFRNVSTYLIGVDLSQVIIDEAQRLRPHLYDETIAGDVADVFRNKKPISLIVAADSYIYFGDLDPLFDSMEEGLSVNDGVVAFTLENVDEDNEIFLAESKPDWRWQLTPSGRFAHRKEYVEQVGNAHQLNVIYYESLDGFRKEMGKAVRGHMFVMKKRGSLNSEL